MLNENRTRLILLIAVTAIHIVFIFFLAFNISSTPVAAPEVARVMRVTDLAEIVPAEIYAPPPPPDPVILPEITNIPMVESIAEVMIETETEPEQIVVAAGSLIIYSDTQGTVLPSWDDYLPIHLVTEAPKFDEREILSGIVYPPIAQRSGIEGRVILELFVDRNGIVQRVLILREEPENRGFGEAAIAAFTGRRGTPALANGEPVSARFRYPLTFRLAR